MVILLVTLGGALAGYLYWRTIGCSSGVCAIGSNKYMSTLVGALLGLLIITSESCSAQTDNQQITGDTATIQAPHVNEEVTPEVFLSKIGTENTVLIDVRTPEEFGGGHIPNSININFNAPDFSAQIEKLDKSKTYLVYCRSGARSGRAATSMSELGFQTIYTLKGGILGWNQPLVQ